MAALTTCSRAAVRSLSRSHIANVRCLSSTVSQHRATATTDVHPTSSFESPFRGAGNQDTNKIPDFSHYRTKSSGNSNLLFQYFMVGTMGALTAAGAKATVQGMSGCHWLLRGRESIWRLDWSLINIRLVHLRSIGMVGWLSAWLDFLVNMSASADVLAMAKVEVDLSTIPEGKNVRKHA